MAKIFVTYESETQRKQASLVEAKSEGFSAG
jgi:hypothetical protein